MSSRCFSKTFPRVVRCPLDAIRNRKFLTVLVDEVVAHLTTNARHLLKLLPANVAKLSLDVLFLCPTVSHRVLDKGGGDTDTRIADRLQTFLVNQEVADFTRVAGACEAPEVLSAMVAVDWSLVALLDKAMAMVEGRCFGSACHKLSTFATVCVACHGGRGGGWQLGGRVWSWVSFLTLHGCS